MECFRSPFPFAQQSQVCKVEFFYVFFAHKSIGSSDTVVVITELPMLYQNNEMSYLPVTKPNIVRFFVSLQCLCRNVGLGLKIRF